MIRNIDSGNDKGSCCVALRDRNRKRVGGSFAGLVRFTGISTIDQRYGIVLCFDDDIVNLRCEFGNFGLDSVSLINPKCIGSDW